MIDWMPTRCYLPSGEYMARVDGVQPRTLIENRKHRPLTIVTLSVIEGRNLQLPWSPKGARFRIAFDVTDGELMESLCRNAGAAGAYDPVRNRIRPGLLKGWVLAVRLAMRERNRGYEVCVFGVAPIQQSVLHGG